MNATRTSKIARLPRPVRAELNERLDNGEMGLQLVAWLNALPEVQAVLAAHFAGRAITEQNLSVWKQGGFADWQRHEAARAWVDRVVEESADLDPAARPVSLADRLAVPVLMEMMKILHEATAAEDPIEKRKAVLGVAHQLTQLRRADYQAERVRLEQERLAMKKEEQARKQRKDEEWAAGVAQIKADFFPDQEAVRRYAGGGGGGGGGGLDPDVAHCLAVNAQLRREAGLPVRFGHIVDPYANPRRGAARRPSSPSTPLSKSNLIQPDPTESNEARTKTGRDASPPASRRTEH